MYLAGRGLFQQSFGVHASNKTHERWVDAVSQQTLNVLAALRNSFSINRQAEVFLLSAKWRTVLRRNAHPGLIGLIGAAPVPQRAEEKQH